MRRLVRLGAALAAGGFGLIGVVAACSTADGARGDGPGDSPDAGERDAFDWDSAPPPPRACEIVECLVDSDCCASANCACSDGSCTYRCATASECPEFLPGCSEGLCVFCTTDVDCPTAGDAATCAANECFLRCQSKDDCHGPGTGLHSACITGACLPYFCDEDLDCEDLGMPALCGPKGVCEVHCTADEDCRSVDSQLDNERCMDGLCVAPGCSSDLECLEDWARVMAPDNPEVQDGGRVKCIDTPYIRP